MAPDFSPEDLAALVNATVPPRVRRASWDAVVTAPEAQQLALLETALLDRAAQSAPSTASAAITGPAPVNRAAAAPVSWEPPSVLVTPLADGASAAGKTVGPTGRALRQPLSARAVYLTTLFVVAAGLLGAALGTASGFFFRRAARTTLAVGATVEHAGWRLRLEELGRRGGSLLVRLRVWPGPAARSSSRSPWAARPRLQLTGAEIVPTFASTVARDDGQEWRLAFPLDRVERAPTLELRPPGARPWLLTLVDSAR